ncbi:MAG TPA: hypothetical protein EYN11_01520 [Phycisphaerales bacterium]|nr:hypothetical protein [Phycisphaerales bacterium]
MAKKRRRRKGNRSSDGGMSTMSLKPGEVPSDEELEAEASSLDTKLTAAAQKKYEKAKKEGFNLSSLQHMKSKDLGEVAKKEKVGNWAEMPRQKLVFEILKAQATRQGLMIGEGTLEIMADGYGFLRSPEYSYVASPDDVYVSPSQIRRFGLRKGQEIRGLIRPPKETETYFAMLRVEAINGRDPKEVHDIATFENLIPLHPDERIHLETTGDVIETRVIDLVAPMGFGQVQL